ncbi:hypothetical protein [Methanoregula boonei]|nr:hypothetical protein [Methanoregula boonei]
MGAHHSSMSDRFISTKYRTDCYHCRALADQQIQATPNRADVTCENCKATRVFVPLIEDVDETGMFTRPGPWPAWSLAVPAVCRNCGVDGLHDLVVSCRHITVRCRNCRFTHLFRFSLEYMAPDKPDEQTSGIVDGHATCP